MGMFDHTGVCADDNKGKLLRACWGTIRRNPSNYMGRENRSPDGARNPDLTENKVRAKEKLREERPLVKRRPDRQILTSWLGCSCAILIFYIIRTLVWRTGKFMVKWRRWERNERGAGLGSEVMAGFSARKICHINRQCRFLIGHYRGCGIWTGHRWTQSDWDPVENVVL